MCGIVGAVARPGARVAGMEVARAMCGAIAHRGPDDEGIHHQPEAFLGMRRLAIIDLETGAQPVYNEDRSVCVVFNGEIYNFAELRRELLARGHRFRSSGDAEVIVHAYEEYGTACFSRLRGMFAIAVWDARERTLVLARDRLGKKPLYYHAGTEALVFGSELKSLLRYPGLDTTVSDEAVRLYCLMGYVPAPLSIFRAVSKLPAAHYLVFREGGVSLHRYWRLAFQPKWEDDEDVLAERLREHLADAVRARLVCDVPFGAFLSGGLDSSVVVALMARYMDRPVKTFSIGFREERYSELDDARVLARHVGAEHEELVVEPDALALLDDLAWYFDEPFADSSAIPTFLVARMAARHVKMVLSGDGGDEAFGGYERYPRFLTVHALQSWGGRLPGRIAAALAGRFRNRRLRRLGWVGTRVSLPFPRSYLSGVALMTPPAAARLLGTAAAPDDYGVVEGLFPAALEAGDAVIAGDVESYLVDDILVKVDRATMANSLEARAPLLDHELLEFAARLPFHHKIRGRVTKRLFRRVARGLLPAALLDKPKQGFAIPLAEWFRGPLHELLQDMVHSRAFIERGAFSPSAVRTLLDEHGRGVADRSEPLWVVLMYELWARRHLDAARDGGEAAGGRPLPEEVHRATMP